MLRVLTSTNIISLGVLLAVFSQGFLKNSRTSDRFWMSELPLHAYHELALPRWVLKMKKEWKKRVCELFTLIPSHGIFAISFN